MSSRTSRQHPARRLGAAALAALAAVGCGRNQAAEPEGRNGPPAPLVETAESRRGPVVRRVTVSGQVRPIRKVYVNSQLAAEVREVLVEEGDRVRVGDPLARLDARQIRAEVAAARAAYEVAKAAYERAEKLAASDVVTEAEFDQERTTYATARAELEQAETRLSYTDIRAPVSGTVTLKAVEMGTVTGTQDRLFAIDDLSTLVVRTQVSELDVVHLEPGNGVTVRLDALPERVLEGRIRRIFPTADSLSRLVPVEVELVDADPTEVRPGFLARVTFPLETRKGAVLAPSTALSGRAGSTFVFVVEEGRAWRRPVEVGLTSDGQVEILEGLAPGEHIVVLGQGQLQDGMEVRTRERLADDRAPAGGGDTVDGRDEAAAGQQATASGPGAAADPAAAASDPKPASHPPGTAPARGEESTGGDER